MVFGGVDTNPSRYISTQNLTDRAEERQIRMKYCIGWWGKQKETTKGNAKARNIQQQHQTYSAGRVHKNPHGKATVLEIGAIWHFQHIAPVDWYHRLFLKFRLPPCPKYFKPRPQVSPALRLHNCCDGNSASLQINHFPLISDQFHYSNYQQTYVQRDYPNWGHSVQSQITNSLPTRL